MCLITKKGANQKTLLVCSELTLLARSSCSLRAEDEGKQYMLQRKITSVHKQVTSLFFLGGAGTWDILGGLHGGWVDDVNELRLQTRLGRRNSQRLGLLIRPNTVILFHLWFTREQDISCLPGFFVTFKEAPPTRKPSTSCFAASSLQFAPVTEPVAGRPWTIMCQDSSQSIFIGQLLKKCIPP